MLNGIFDIAAGCESAMAARDKAERMVRQSIDETLAAYLEQDETGEIVYFDDLLMEKLRKVKSFIY
jgi:hypothetical protein